MFLANKYSKWYFNIIENAKIQNRKKLKRENPNFIYLELHHIIPRSLNGSNNKENMIYLTAKEHFICHLLLPKMLNDNISKHKMINALIKMQFNKSNGQQRYKSKSYAVIRGLIAEKNSYMFKGKPKSKETKLKMSISAKGKPKSETHKKSMSDYMRANPRETNPMDIQEYREKVRQHRLTHCQVYHPNDNITFEINNNQLIDYISKGYKKGHPHAANGKGKKWFKSPNFDQEGRFIINEQPIGWISGRLPYK